MTDSLFKERKLRWGGEDVFFVPDVRMLQRIKSEGVNNLRLSHECLVGTADPADFAFAMKHMLAKAGVTASLDECYDFLTSGDVEDIILAQTSYVESVNPRIDLGKKQEAPAKEAKAKKKVSETT